MAIITISRGSYSSGREVAEQLAKRLGYECISRDILLETCEEFSIPELRLEKALHDAPSLLDRFRQGRERYINCFKATFLNHLSRDNVVYHGLAGHFFLKDCAHAFKVRITADMESRVRAEVAREGTSREEAKELLQKDDAERRSRSMAPYGKDTWDSSLYDMVINIDTMTVFDSVEILAGVIENGRFDATEDSTERLRDESTIANIEAELVFAAPRVTVSLKDGVLTVSNLDGHLGDMEVREKVSNRFVEDYGVKNVVFSESGNSNRAHVNNFYNLPI